MNPLLTKWEEILDDYLKAKGLSDTQLSIGNVNVYQSAMMLKAARKEAAQQLSQALKDALPEKHAHSTTHNSDYKLENGYGEPCTCNLDPFNEAIQQVIDLLEGDTK